jgi:uncharacterized damage-inducible protein DinB
MTNREFYLKRQRAELPAFMKVLKALPVDRLDYRPHERSPNARQIVWLLTGELQIGIDAVKNYRAEWQILPPPPMPEMLQKFENGSQELIDLVSEMPEPCWEHVAHFYFKGALVLEQPVGTFLWLNLFDAIHHRGQLTAYLHPMGAGMPAIYTPPAGEAA